MRVPPTGRGGGPPKNKKKKHQIWDIRTKNGIHVLTGHTNTVASVVAQAATPQVISGGMDSTIRLWDLAAGTLTRTAIGEDFPGGCAMSPTGDRIVYQDGATYEIYELTRRDGFQTARLLQVPLRPVNEVWLYVSAAGEVVWENDGTLFAWAEGDAQPTQSGGAGGTRLTLIPRSSSYHMHVCEMPSNRFVPMK